MHKSKTNKSAGKVSNFDRRNYVTAPPSKLGQNLYAAMQAKGINSAYALADLTDRLGHKVNQSMISGLLSEENPNPKFATLEKIALALGLNVAELLDFKNLDKTGSLSLQKVPVLSWSEVKGWRTVLNKIDKSARELIHCTVHTSADAFALPVHGDSMAPDFSEGDHIVVDPSREAVSGDFVVAIGNAGDGAILRRLVSDGAIRVLGATNNQYPPLKITKNTKIIGVVVSKTRNF